jgi:hypothetical protein
MPLVQYIKNTEILTGQILICLRAEIINPVDQIRIRRKEMALNSQYWKVLILESV